MKTKVEIEAVPRDMNASIADTDFAKEVLDMDLENFYYISDENVNEAMLTAVRQGFKSFAILTPTYLYVTCFMNGSKYDLTCLRKDYYAINIKTTFIEEE